MQRLQCLRRSQCGNALNQAAYGDLQLHACKWLADAAVDSSSKSQVRSRRAADVELVRVGEQCRVAISRRLVHDDRIVLAYGQLSSFMMDHGLSLEDAFHQPRIDVSGASKIIADKDLSPDFLEALRNVLPLTEARRIPYPYSFACPAGVMREGNMNMGCTEIMSPYGDAVSGG